MSSILERSAVFRSWTKDPIYEKIKEVAPDRKLKDSFMMEVQEATVTCFQKIGYNPNDVFDAIDKAWAKSKGEDSFTDFIYKVWRFDNEQR